MEIEWTKCTSLGRPTFGTCSFDPVWGILRLLKARIVRNKGKVQKNMQHEFFLLPSRFFSTFPFVKIFHSPNLSKHPPAAIVSLFNKADHGKGFELHLRVLSMLGITQTVKQMFGIICIPGNLHSLELALKIDTVVLALCDSTASCPKKTNL